MNRKKLAVNVVLLPPENVMDKAIEVNQGFLRTSGHEIELNKQTCLPHISLAMGCIDETNLEKIAKILQKISKEFSPLPLQATSLCVETIPTGKRCSTFVVEKSEQLRRLHKTVMIGLKPFLLMYGPTIEMVYGSPEVEEVTLYWIKNYFEKSSFENFDPHITVGLGETDAVVQFPISFTASKLALCHLGNYCTCRKILFSVELSSG